MDNFLDGRCTKEHVRITSRVGKSLGEIGKHLGMVTILYSIDIDHAPKKHELLQASRAFHAAGQYCVGKFRELQDAMTVYAFYEAMFSVNEHLIPTLQKVEEIIGERIKLDDQYPSEIMKELIKF